LDDLSCRIENARKNNTETGKYRKKTKQRLRTGEKELEVIKTCWYYGNSFLPITFIFKLKDPSKSKEVVSAFEKMEGVDEVRFHEIAVNFFLKLSYWAKVIGLMLLIILLIISAFIISNTIKLTVFARRREIGIICI
jgi:cell division transport system permease protein